jgi:hypothetical protein
LPRRRCAVQPHTSISDLRAKGAYRPETDAVLGAGVVSAFVLPLIWIPAMNLIGPIFFFLETHSVLRERRASTRGNLVAR